MSSIEQFDLFCTTCGISKPKGLLIRLYSRVFLVPDSLKSILSKFQPRYIGECLGSIRKNTFFPSQLFLQKYCQQLARYELSRAVAKKFIYGKDIALNDKDRRSTQYVVVTSEDIPLGIGKIENRMLYNVFDIGQSLRNEIFSSPHKKSAV